MITNEEILKYRKQFGITPGSFSANTPSAATNNPSNEIDSFRNLLSGTQSKTQSENGGGIAQVVTEPFRTLVSQPGIRTGQAIGSLGLKLANKLSGGKVSENIQARTGQTLDERLANVVSEDVTTKGGTVISKGVNQFGEGGGKQIIGEAVQSASYLIPYGKVAGAAGGGTLGNIAAGATGGYTADVGYGLTDKNQTVGQALTPGVGTAIGAAIPGVLPAVTAAGRLTSKAGSKLVESVIPTSSREASMLQTYKANKPFLQRVGDVLSGTEKAPITAGKTALTTKQGQTVNGLFGTKSQIGIQAKRASDSLWSDVISPRLKESTKAVDLDQFFNKIEGDIIAKNPELSRQKSLLEGLQSIREDYAGTKVISLDKLQKLKEGWAQFVPEKAYNGKPIAGAFNDVRNLMSGEARQTIYNELGDDVKQAYIDYGNLTGLKEMGKKSMTGQALKGGTGGLVSEIFSQTVTPVGTVGGQVLYRIGNGLEFLGNTGAKKLSQVLGVADNVTQEANIPMKAQSTTTPKMIKNSSISPVSKKNGIMSSDLSTEAKKYKSAEEFVKAQPKLFHGGTADIQEIKLGKSNFQKTFYMSDNADYAKSYGGKNSSLNEIWLDPNAKIADLRNPNSEIITEIESIISSKPTGKIVKIQKPDGSFIEVPETTGGLQNAVHSTKEIIQGIKDGKAYFTEMPEVKTALKNLGYDGMITQESKFGANYGVWNKDIVQTKSQLTDIWNKTNKKVTLPKSSDLSTEAKKYKSAEEFVNSQTKKSGLYHGTIFDFPDEKIGTGEKYNPDTGKGGIFFSSSQLEAQTAYGKPTQVPKSYSLKPGTKIVEIEMLTKENVEKALKDGADGVTYTNNSPRMITKDQIRNEVTKIENSTEYQNEKAIMNDWLNGKIKDLPETPSTDLRALWLNADKPKHTVLFDNSKLLTKQQLKDIWNKANKK